MRENNRKHNGGDFMMENNHDTFTVTGTNIDAVKRQNERSGMSYMDILIQKQLALKPCVRILKDGKKKWNR